MKVFVNNKFKGVWPVGAAAVVVAPSKKEAVELLREELKTKHLSEGLSENQFEEINTREPRAFVLRDGDY